MSADFNSASISHHLSDTIANPSYETGIKGGRGGSKPHTWQRLNFSLSQDSKKASI